MASQTPLTLAAAIERIKEALELDTTLKGKAAVDAAKAAILSRAGKLKDQIQIVCNELRIETVSLNKA